MINKTKIAKVSAIVAGTAVALSMASSAFAAGLTSAQVDSIVNFIAAFNVDAATINNVRVALTGEGTTVPTPGTCTTYTFSKNLKLGNSGADVKALQQILNKDVATQVAATGVGSAGNESEYFGAMTKAAVIKFQELYKAEVLTPANLTKGTGFVGSMTLAKLNLLSVCSTDDTTTPPIVTGPVTVFAAANNPAGGALIGGQSAAEIAQFEFKGNGTVSSVTLTRSGISDQSALTNVYLYDGSTRLTDGYAFNTNSTLTMNNLNLVVNGSRVISVRADVMPDAVVSHATVIATLTSFTADGVVNGANVSGGMMQFASGTLASATLGGTNVIAGDVNAGTTGYTFWSQSIQVNTRALILSGANFRMIGSAPADALSNIKLYVNGVDQGVVGSVISISGVNYVKFDMTAAPLTLATGSHTINVRATVEKGSSRTVQLSLQQAADLTLKDGQIGVNIAVTGTVPQSAGIISINSGSATVAEDIAFKSVSNVTGGASNVAIGKFTVHGYGEDIKVSSLSVTPTFTASTTPVEAGLSNVTLYFNGSQVGSTQATWTSGAIAFQLGSQLIVPAGVDSTIEVRADIRTTGNVNYTGGAIRTTLNLGAANAQGQSSYSALAFPTANVVGTALTIQTGLLAASKNSGFSDQSITPSTQGVKIGSYVLQNQSSSEGVRVTNLAVGMNVVTAALTDFSALTTSETATPVQPQSTNTFSVDFILAPGETKTIDILANTGNQTSGTASTTLTLTSVGVTSGVSNTSSVIVGQTVTFAAGIVTDPPTFVTTGSTPAQLVAAAGGSTAGSVAKFNFASTGGASTLKALQFTIGGSVDNTITSVTVGSVTIPVVGGVAYVTNLNIPVPLGGSGLTQDVKVNYSPVGLGGIPSTATSSISLTSVTYDGGNGQTTITPTTALSSTITLVGSKPTFAVTDVNTTLTNGLVEIARVTVTADTKGDINLGELPISVTSTGVASVATSTNNIVVKDSDGNTISTTNASFSVLAGQTGTSTIVFGASSAAAYPIAAGTPVTLSIYVTGATVSGAVNTTSLSTSLGSAANVKWYDVAGSNSTVINGSLLSNYPSNTSVISNQ